MMTLDLPPPTVFTHKETLHRIELPSLAKFLHSLSEPAHLVRLHDILDQYRTPQSYHRVDVREISSSELPPAGVDETEQSTAAADVHGSRGGGRRLYDGEPIELDEDVTLEQHQSVKLPNPPRESSPEASHPLPPMGPKRRIRELRLDLRTLDPSALFALENWRRDVSGLDKLPFAHPDSVWYKSPTPEPPAPSPPVEPVVASLSPASPAARASGQKIKGPGGRPRKQYRASQGLSNATVSPSAPDARAGRRASTRQTMSMSAPTEVIEVLDDTEVEVNAATANASVFDIALDDVNGETANGVANFNADTTGDGSVSGPISAEVAGAINSGDPQPPVNSSGSSSADARRSLPRDNSPDQILIDDYKRAEDDDSDFEPEPSPPRPGPGRPRNRANAEASGSRTAFACLPSPQPMLETFSANMESRTGPRPFAKLPSPAPMLGSRDRTRKPGRAKAANASSQREEAGSINGLSPTRRISLSPSKRSVSPQKRSSVGYDSNAPIWIPDSPVTAAQPLPTKLPIRQSAFVPFVREPMRMPSYIGNHDDAKAQPSIYPDDTSSAGHGPARNGSKSGRGRPSQHRVSGSDEPRREVKQKKQVVEDDEWAEFRF